MIWENKRLYKSGISDDILSQADKIQHMCTNQVYGMLKQDEKGNEKKSGDGVNLWEVKMCVVCVNNPGPPKPAVSMTTQRPSCLLRSDTIL